MFGGIVNKLKMVNAARGLLSGDGLGNMETVIEMVEPFLTDENIATILQKLADAKKQHEAKEGVAEIAYLLRSTPDGNNIYVDVLEVKDNIPVRTIAQYDKSNLRELIKMIKDANAAKK